MRILFVSVMTNPLNAPKDGDAQRTRLLLKACSRIAEVDLLTFAGKSEGRMDNVQVVYDNKISRRQHVESGRFKKWVKVMPFTRKQALLPVDERLESIIDSIVQLGNYDIIVSRYFHRTVLCGLWKYQERLVVDFDDSPSSLFLNQISDESTLSLRIRMRLAAKKITGISEAAVKQIKTAFFSNKEQAVLSHGVFLPNIPLYGERCNNVDFKVQGPRILFVGLLDYLPNKQGVEHFLKKVYLSLHDRLPQVEMHIVGSLSDDNTRVRWQSFPNVTVTGFVEDLQKEYAEARVVVVPIYQCGGTNIKMLEAMKMNRACVTTSIVTDRLDWQSENGKSFMSAHSDSEFVQYTEMLLTDNSLNVKIAEQGMAFMEQYYSFESFCRIVELNLLSR